MYHRALKTIRTFHDLNQSELAEKLDFSKSYISELEVGRKKPSIDVLEKYADYFRIPLSSLMLFAEKSSDNGFVEKGRVFAADKVLQMLEWMAIVADTKDNG